MTEEEFAEWRKNKLLYGMHWRRLVDRNTKELLKYNETAVKYINGEVPQIFASGYNDVAEQVPDSPVAGFDFELVNAETVNNLIKEEGLMLPKKELDPKKDVAWNAKQINAQILQGILQGETIPEMSKRMLNVTNSDEAGAVRTARTMHTAAQNYGRQCGYNKAAKQGIIFEKTWLAANNERTRESHAMMSGQTVDVDEPFVSPVTGVKLMFPGDWNAEGDDIGCELYNCRCTLITKFKGFNKLKLEEAAEEQEEKRAQKEQTKAEKRTESQKRESETADKKKQPKVDEESLREHQKNQDEGTTPSVNFKIGDALEACKTEREISKAAQDYFRAKEGCKIEVVDLLHVEPQIAKQIVLKLDELDNKYYSSLTEIKTTTSLPDATGGRTDPDLESFYEYVKTNDSSVLKSVMMLNSNHFKDMDTVMRLFKENRNDIKNGITEFAEVDEKNAALATIVHEYGHSILPGKANEKLIEFGGENEIYEKAKQIYSEYANELRGLNEKAQDVRFQYAGQPDGLRKGNEAAQKIQEEYNSICISRYSKTSTGEFIAEAFCNAVLCSEPKEYAKRIKRLLDKEMKK